MADIEWVAKAVQAQSGLDALGSPVEKFNHNHGADGKFTSGSGGGGGKSGSGGSRDHLPDSDSNPAKWSRGAGSKKSPAMQDLEELIAAGDDPKKKAIATRNIQARQAARQRDPAYMAESKRAGDDLARMLRRHETKVRAQQLRAATEQERNKKLRNQRELRLLSAALRRQGKKD